MTEYFPSNVRIARGDEFQWMNKDGIINIAENEVLIVDEDLEGYECAVVCRFDPLVTDLSVEMLENVAKKMVDIINGT